MLRQNRPHLALRRPSRACPLLRLALGTFANDGRGNGWTIRGRCEEPAIYSFVQLIGVVSFTTALGLDHPASGIKQNVCCFEAKRPLASTLPQP